MMKRICSLLLCVILLAGCAPVDSGSNIVAEERLSQAIEEAIEVAQEEAELIEPTPVPEAEEKGADPLPLEGRIICLDPGHCISNASKSEPMSPLSDVMKAQYTRGTSGANLSEVELNLIVGLMLKAELEAMGAEVVMTREVNEITISGLERVEIGNNSGADFVIRIHADGANDSSVHGVSALVPSGDLLGYPEIAEESVRLGQLMVDCVAEKTGAKNLGAIPRSDLQGHNWSSIPSVFLEMGYMTNSEEDALLETEAYQKLIVQGVVEAILLWYGEG